MSCWTVNVNAKPRWTDVAAAVRDKIYFFGDYDNSVENITTIGPGDVQVFHTDNYQWSVLKNQNFSQINEILPHFVMWQSAVVYNEMVWETLVYLFADINYQDRNVLFCFDTNSHLWSKPIVSGMVPFVRGTVNAICAINDSMYIFGGFDNISGLYSQNVYKLDLRSLKWSYVPTTGQPPMYRVGHSATAIQNDIFIYGGSGPRYHNGRIDHVELDDVNYLDTQTMNWITPEVIGYRPVGRVDHSAFSYKGQLFVIGGTNYNLEETFNDLWRYSPDSRCWSLMEPNGNGPYLGTCQTCILIQDRVFMIARRDHHNLIHALDLAPSLKTLSILAVLEHKLNQKGLPETVLSDIKLINSEEIQSENNAE